MTRYHDAVTRREILALVHASNPCTPEGVAAILGVDPPVVFGELQVMQRLGLVKPAAEQWRAMHPTLDASVAAMEALNEDPDMEITMVMVQRHR